MRKFKLYKVLSLLLFRNTLVALVNIFKSKTQKRNRMLIIEQFKTGAD